MAVRRSSSSAFVLLRFASLLGRLVGKGIKLHLGLGAARRTAAQLAAFSRSKITRSSFGPSSFVSPPPGVSVIWSR